MYCFASNKSQLKLCNTTLASCLVYYYLPSSLYYGF